MTSPAADIRSCMATTAGGATISVPVQIWHGERDAAVPPADGHCLAGQTPAVDAYFPANDDHGSIHDDHLAEAYGWLRQFG